MPYPLGCVIIQDKGVGIMKRKIFLAVGLAVFSISVLMSGCASENEESKAISDSVVSENIATDDQEKETDSDGSLIESIKSLNQGDSVSVVGQKANSALVNGKTIWVQVLDGEDTIIYYCDLKEEFRDEGEALSLLDVVKVNGSFLSVSESQSENMAHIVTLYDCEIAD